MEYKFKIQHVLAVVGFLILATMSFRSRVYESDWSLISWMLVVVALSAASASWYHARWPTICILSWIAGSAVTWFRPSIVGCLNCFLAVRSERLAIGETFFINSREHIVPVAATLSVVSIVFGGLVGKLVALNREWIRINFVSFAVLVAATFLAGCLGNEYGKEIMPRVSRNQASVIGGIVGLIFSGAWIGTNRPFVKPTIGSKKQL